MSRFDKIREQIAKGVDNSVIAERFGVPTHTVSTLRWRMNNLERYRRAQSAAAERRRRRAGQQSRDERSAVCKARVQPIIAAVRSGMTYAEVARTFGLPSRNVVAGIISRYGRNDSGPAYASGAGESA